MLIRADSGRGTHEFLAWLTRPGRHLHYSVGFPITDEVQAAILAGPKTAWLPAYDAGRQVRPGAWVAELTSMLNLAGWPKGMRVIARKERPHPGAPAAVHRPRRAPVHLTGFATSAKGRAARRPRTTPLQSVTPCRPEPRHPLLFAGATVTEARLPGGSSAATGTCPLPLCRDSERITQRNRRHRDICAPCSLIETV